MSRERMTVMDASFLYSDDGRSHNDVGMVLVLEGPAPSREELLVEIGARLPVLPKFRSRLRHLPFQAALPVWIDAVDFVLADHVVSHGEVSALLGPDEDPDAVDLVGLAVSHCMSARMDMTRPLWEIHQFDGFGQSVEGHVESDQWLLVIRMHHAMVDGVSSTEIVHLLCGEDPEGAPPVRDDWVPEPEPTDAELLAESARDAARDAASMFAESLRPRAFAPPKLGDVDLRPLLRPGPPLADSAMNGPLGPSRTWAMTEVALDELKQIKTRLGGTINDVVLAACAHGFGRFLTSQGQHVEGRVMRTMVPVSMRSAGDASAGGNEIAAMVIELPLGLLPPDLLLARVREQTEAFKKLKDAVPGDVSMSQGSALMSPTSLMAGVRVAATAPVTVNTVITNVPGPRVPLYLAGARLERLAACIALWNPLNLALSVISYDGTATLGVVAGGERYPDLSPLLDAIDEGLDRLRDAALGAGPDASSDAGARPDTGSEPDTGSSSSTHQREQ